MSRVDDISDKHTYDTEQLMIKIMLENCLKHDDVSDWQFIETDKKKSMYAQTDGMLVKNGNIVAVVENRGRYDVDMEYLKKEGTWLVSEKKINANKTLSALLQVPFLFCGYIEKDKIYGWVKMTDGGGHPLVDYEVRETLTRKHKNTQEKVRKRNAYIPIKEFKFEVHRHSK